ncbi:MAG TPA: hypothetical protein VIG04_03820 [Gemmatimonadales bacterium]
MHSLIRIGLTSSALSLTLLTLSCDSDSLDPAPDDSGSPAFGAGAPAPGLLVPVAVPGGSLMIWPYTGTDLTGTPQDPINLVFTGKSDPRAIRAALMALDGNRTAFGMPQVSPFNCKWSDAIGDLQTGYNAPHEWVGSAIQLACGDYGPIRFHVRLFEAGTTTTLGNAHFEVLIPGTADHQVLSWELAEQLVTVDFIRSGLLDPSNPIGSTGLINDAPFREIPAQIYNLIPADLKSLIGGPAGNVGVPVPIGSDGHATVFNVTADGGQHAAGTEQSFVIQYGQVIPRPFCASGAEYLYVEGPVSLRKTVQVTNGGDLTTEFEASGHLRLTPVNPETGTPIGPTYEANVKDEQVTRFDKHGGMVRGLQVQTELPRNVAGHGQRVIRIKVGATGPDLYKQDIDCTP